jgi:uncharacterized protein
LDLLSPELFATLLALAFLAGFLDSVVGGGGLIQIPALFVLLPQLPPATVFGTNKFASIWGTTAAAWQYSRQMPLEWRATLPAATAALIAGFLGALTVAHVPAGFLKPLVLVLLVSVLAYTLWRKDFGRLHTPRLSHAQQLAAGLLVGAIIGFYDGFFGPGTGSFLIFAFVGLFGFSFLAASASAKIVNVITNAAALAYFATHGYVLYSVAVPMAVCNVAGSIIGARMAIRRGSGFVRGLFLVIVGALILRYGWDLL